MATATSYLFRFKAGSLHFGGNVIVAILLGALVWHYWYPYPYWDLAGGRGILTILLVVDLVLGPLLTFMVASPKKDRRQLSRDIAVIIACQLAGLVYGIYVLGSVRPLALVAEYRSFRVVTPVDILDADWESIPSEVTRWGRGAPVIFGISEPQNEAERRDRLLLLASGKLPGSLPKNWRPYVESKETVLSWAKSVEGYCREANVDCPQLRLKISSNGLNASQVKILSVIAREQNWVAFLDSKTGDVKGFAHLPN